MAISTTNQKTSALNIVVYDLTGKPISDDLAQKIEQAVYDVTIHDRLAISVVRG